MSHSHEHKHKHEHHHENESPTERAVRRAQLLQEYEVHRLKALALRDAIIRLDEETRQSDKCG